jgi:hypothetical protein
MMSFFKFLICFIMSGFTFDLLYMPGLHLVLLPKDDDPSKAVLAACNEKELIRLAAQKCNAATANGLYLNNILYMFILESMLS